MKTPIPRRLGWAALQLGLFTAALPATFAAELNWIQTARVFLIDAYQPPFAPKLEYDAEALARTMVEMRANTVRISTMGKYATIPGVRFSTHPDLGARDVLAETIAARKPRGIRTVAYISTGPIFSRFRRLLRKTNQWPEVGSCPSTLWTHAYRPLKP